MKRFPVTPTIGIPLFLTICLCVCPPGAIHAEEYHVSKNGNDANPGTQSQPFETISAAAAAAQPGDVITVHEGVYRERINPPRGGTASEKRIVYQAAEGETVCIKGSEVVTGWEKVGNDTWKVTLPDTFFGEFNPFKELIAGDWFNPKGRVHHLGAVYLDGHWLTEAASLDEVLEPAGESPLWYTPVPAAAGHKDAPSIELEDDTTTIWAQFKGVDPNKGNVEINVRQTVFYPEKPGVNFITVRGFTLEHAAPNWAPPTAEQVGLIGTHWSKGWIIEDNTIRYSNCTGVTLGKHGDEFDNTSQNSADGYVETIKRAQAFQIPWTRQHIGHHVVRNNHIAHCEQAGIVGSMGAAFSTVTGNTIYDINRRGLFDGAEKAGIKFHGAIDAVISQNHIHHTMRGIWLDWMTQGTRVTGNLLHDNGPREDLFVEVNHGPFLVDNNILLSPIALLEASGGGAYAHNLFAGQVRVRQERTRDTPYHPAHSTTVAGLSKVVGDDERFYNNLFAGPAGLTTYDKWGTRLQAAGNVYVNGAKPSQFDQNPTTDASLNPQLKLIESDGGVTLQITLNAAWAQQQRTLVTTELLGKARISNLPFVQPDDSPYRIDTDYLGQKRDASNPFAGPFEYSGDGIETVLIE